MNDKEIRRLKRFVVFSWVALVLTMALFVAWVGWQVRDVKAVATQAVTRQPVKGDPGQNASPEQIATAVAEYLTLHPPAAGKDGRDGKDGINAVSTNTIQYVPEKGDKGDRGIAGKAARDIELAKDSLGNILWRYSGTDAWLQLTEVVQ